MHDEIHANQHAAPAACNTCEKTDCSAAHARSGESEADFLERQALQSKLCRIRHKIVVLSGKGGVGKSTVAVNLAAALAAMGYKTGLLDVDIHGPSIPTMLGIEGASVQSTGEEMIPVEINGLKVLSLGFFLRHPDDAVIWRGPMKMGVIRQFLKEAAWGDLDFLVIDSPPGTGDEPLSVVQLIDGVDGAVIVTTPQRVASVDVRKSITFCRHLQVPVLGVVENMSGFACPNCGAVTPILLSGGGRKIASDMGVPFLGAIPMDPQMAEAGDAGQVFVIQHPESPAARALQEIIRPIAALGDGPLSATDNREKQIKEEQP